MDATQIIALSRFRGAMARQRRGVSQQLRTVDGELTQHYLNPMVGLPYAVLLGVCEMILAVRPRHEKAFDIRKGVLAAPKGRDITIQVEPCGFDLLDAANELYPFVEPPPAPPEAIDPAFVAGEGKVPPPYDTAAPPPVAV